MKNLTLHNFNFYYKKSVSFGLEVLENSKGDEFVIPILPIPIHVR
jgi:hypothetical protein